MNVVEYRRYRVGDQIERIGRQLLGHPLRQFLKRLLGLVANREHQPLLVLEMPVYRPPRDTGCCGYFFQADVLVPPVEKQSFCGLQNLAPGFRRLLLSSPHSPLHRNCFSSYAPLLVLLVPSVPIITEAHISVKTNRVAEFVYSLKIEEENRNRVYSSSAYKPRASFLVQFPHVGK